MPLVCAAGTERLYYCVQRIFIVRPVFSDSLYKDRFATDVLFFAGAVTFAKPRLSTFLKYAKVELKPPMPNEFPQVAKGFNDLLKAARKGHWKQVTVKVHNLLFCDYVLNICCLKSRNILIEIKELPLSC